MNESIVVVGGMSIAACFSNQPAIQCSRYTNRHSVIGQVLYRIAGKPGEEVRIIERRRHVPWAARQRGVHICPIVGGWLSGGCVPLSKGGAGR